MVSDSGLVVVVVLSFNKKEVTLRCLNSVQEIDYAPYEVVVVDNGSTDGSTDAIAEAFPNYHLLRNTKNLGPSGGRNTGMAFANKHFTPEYMFFLDNDTEMDKKILINLIEAIKKWPSAGIACPKAYQKFPSSILMSMGLHVNFSKALIYDIGCGEEDEGQYDTVRSVDACGSFGVLVKQEVLNKLGEWDNQFYPYGWEDVDLCLRATKLGYETLCVPQAIIYHAGGQVGRGTVVSYEEYKIKHFFLLLKKHGTRFQYVSCLFWIPWRGFLRVFSNLRKGDYQLVTAQLRGIMKFLVK